jgi:hypothetical protein
MIEALNNIAAQFGFLSDINNTKSSDAGKSNLKMLYKNLAKNARLVSRLGEKSYPEISYSFDNKNGHSFSNSNNFSKAFNDSLPLLNSLMKVKTSEDTPCLSLVRSKKYKSLPQIMTEISNKSEMLDKYAPSASILNDLRNCGEDHCDKCINCDTHRKELTDAVKGAVNTENHSDEVRNYHIKNILTILYSWANHQDSRGNDSRTSNDDSYQEDAFPHLLFGTQLRLAAHKLHRAYEKDYEETSGAGGGNHNDNFNQSVNERDAY